MQGGKIEDRKRLCSSSSKPFRFFSTSTFTKTVCCVSPFSLDASLLGDGGRARGGRGRGGSVCFALSSTDKNGTIDIRAFVVPYSVVVCGRIHTTG